MTVYHRDRKTGTQRDSVCVCAVSYTHLRAHETDADLVCRLLLEKNLFLMIRRPPRSTPAESSAASDVYKRQLCVCVCVCVTLESVCVGVLVYIVHHRNYVHVHEYM